MGQQRPPRSWEFTSGVPSSDTSTDVTDVEYTWTHGWQNDYDALNRKFRTAVIVNRDLADKLAMAVQVEVKPMKGWKASPPQEKRSGWLQPTHNVDEAMFQSVLDNLEMEILEANQAANRPTLATESVPAQEQGVATLEQIDQLADTADPPPQLFQAPDPAVVLTTSIPIRPAPLTAQPQSSKSNTLALAQPSSGIANSA